MDNDFQGYVLVVDDNADNRDLLTAYLEMQGHTVDTASNGQLALEAMLNVDFDVVLLDIMMPVMNGYMVLEKMREDAKLQHLPVIVISAMTDIESIVRCIELGATDYLFKPFDRTLLKARIQASLEKKRARDREQVFLQELQVEREKSEQLLLNILPEPIADRLKQGQNVIADSFDAATVLFADIVGFTELSAEISASELITFLNNTFSAFDSLVDRYNLEKIKTIGDAYVVAGGVPIPRADHLEAIVQLALDMQQEAETLSEDNGNKFTLRIGIDTGPVVAGVIGTKKFSYDLWGDTVNTASRMESHGIPGAIQVTQTVHDRLNGKFQIEERGPLEVKGKGTMTTYFVRG